MKDQGAPITEEEWLLRRVHLENFDSINPPKISLYAFKPQVKGRSPDTTGISFYRQSCIQDIEEVLAKTDETKRAKYGIVRLPLSLLVSNRLAVVRDDDHEHPIVLGHVVLPKISSTRYSSDKDEVLPSMKLLADFVNEQQEFLLLPSDESG
jgi:hypothetical protein